MSTDTMTTTIPGAKVVPTISNTPRDIRILQPWFNLIRRLRSIAPVRDDTYSVLKVTILMRNGRPVKWVVPRTAKALEPRINCEDWDILLAALAD